MFDVYIYIYIIFYIYSDSCNKYYMYGLYVCFLNMRWLIFSPKKHGFFGLTPVSSDTTALRKSHFKLRLKP